MSDLDRDVADVLRRVSEIVLVEARNVDEYEAELFSAITEAEEKLAWAKSYLRDLEDDWVDFIDAHPELTARPSQESRLEFTDDELLAALSEALRRWDEELKAIDRKFGEKPRRAPFDGGVMSNHVAKVLAHDDDYTSGDVVRVGQRLGKLARAGRVVRVVEPYRTLRYLVADDG